MLLPNYRKLFKPYAGNSCTVGKMIEWAAKSSGAPKEVIDVAVKNLFREMAQGKTFSTTGCDCGCEMTNAHSAINHYFLREVLKLKEQMAETYWQALEKMDAANIEKHIKVVNKQWKKENKVPWYRRAKGSKDGSTK